MAYLKCIERLHFFVQNLLRGIYSSVTQIRKWIVFKPTDFHFALVVCWIVNETGFILVNNLLVKFIIYRGHIPFLLKSFVESLLTKPVERKASAFIHVDIWNRNIFN